MNNPIEVTIDSDNGHQIASFSYNNGLSEVQSRNLKQTTKFSEVFKGTHFIVCCGDIMFKVDDKDYPNIERRTI